MSGWLVLQLADSAFPTGGFAHSAGLEAAAALGEVGGAAGLRGFCAEALWQVGLGALPFVRAAHGAAGDLAVLGALDARCHAFLSSHVANRGSRTQGRAFAATVARVFPRPALVALDEALRAKALHGHLAPVFGAALAALEVEVAEAQRLFLHQSLRGVTSAAVRLGLAGPHEAQRMQHELAPLADEVLARCGAIPVEDAAQPAPLLDLFGATHDRLYARLFQS
jgi:urease accessory protein